MYVTTFYSFKGGVGRTMALVNSAIALAAGGRKVLVVDFDIEAPGLDTFDVLKTPVEKPGLVDFVAAYLDSGQAPEVSEYVSECPDFGTDGGKLWLMRSGHTETYTASFQRIDWGALYEFHDGFLLFEDLKEQWREVLNPDYVLIDSRTGHTDTSGICTRQLPDAVVVLFFPNEQNLRGLTEVVADIRAEGDGPREKKIDLHFVMSNVPDLDDEDRILESKINAFKRQLGLRKDPMIVHRYDSLSLLNQTVFVKERPASRLSKEYREIVKEVSARNSKDRDGAMEYIHRARRTRRWRGEVSLVEQSEMLDRIERDQGEDGEVIFALSELKHWLGDSESAQALLSRVLELGHNDPEAFLRHSEILEEKGESEGASSAALRVLGFENIPAHLVRSAISRLLRIEGKESIAIIDTPAVSTLDVGEKLWVADSLESSDASFAFRVSLYEQIFESRELPESRRSQSRNQLGLLYIMLGRFNEASRLFRVEGKSLQDLPIEDMFNYAMSEWGANEKPPIDAFARIVEMDLTGSDDKRSPNYLQCMAVAFIVTDNRAAALDSLERSREAANTSRQRTEFSCWRYRQANMKDFVRDLDEMQAWIETTESRVQKSKMPVFSEQKQSPSQ